MNIIVSVKAISIILLMVWWSSGVQAKDSINTFQIGYALSGPVLGLSFGVQLSQEFKARVIYSSDEMMALQLHRQPRPNDTRHFIFGVGMLNETPYLRGAVGRSSNKGPWRFSGEIGLNLPLEKLETDGEGLAGVINAYSYLIFVGAGLHYEF